MDGIDVKNIKKVHCVGIGGIGLSALARLFIHEGKKVSGSDAAESELIHRLREEGVDVSIGHRKENIKDADLVIYSVAILSTNPEIEEALSRGIPTCTYPQALGLITNTYRTVAVAGTHGKTTTTAMITELLDDAGVSPNAIVGSVLKKYKSNFVAGKSDVFVVEACEYHRSFLNVSPEILVITNIDIDHLDYYKDLADIQSAFRDLAESVPKEGYIITDSSHENILPVLDKVQAHVIDYTATECNLTLEVPGNHNIRNAQAALAVAKIFGIDKDQAKESLEKFAGTWRRGELKGVSKGGALIYDDYAHHPTEIKTTLEGFRERYKDYRIIAVFQPHLYSRTKEFLHDFALSFEAADEIVVLPIYAAREIEDPSISSELLMKEIEKPHAVYKESFQDALHFIEESVDHKTLVITMGAGDVFKVADMLVVDISD
jgi:UDP-N-acetylmuramate--alanine ligase